MRKLMLEIEKLAVESFETDAVDGQVRGTVRGNDRVPAEKIEEPETGGGATEAGFTCPYQICDPMGLSDDGSCA
jgi:nanoRNase/pAp phosphatase (c-di-AMP/oligoRNAs hydrolase)